MKEGNNGGYANDWLVPIAKPERSPASSWSEDVNLKRTKDGYFVGLQFSDRPALAREETEYDLSDPSLSANARHIRWIN